MNSTKEILDQIRDLWNNYIFKLKFFRDYYKFDAATASNHFGQILDHFSDSMYIINETKIPDSIHNRYSFNIALLQTIFVQQDLIEEMHRIFKTNVNKGKLYEDTNYKINREMRNELVGHPIRRKDGNGEMISSVTLSYQTSPENIAYIRYHKDREYAHEKIEQSVSDIVNRHLDFLNSNLNLIYKNIHKSLRKYLNKTKEIRKVLDLKDINAITRLVEHHYETFQDENYLYQSNQIIEVHTKKGDHPRYQLMLDDYYFNLDYHLKEMTNSIESIIEGEEREIIGYPIDVCKHHYEVGKLWTKRNRQDFKFFGELLETKVKDEYPLVLEELSFMEKHIDDEVEYYSACNYIQKKLTE